LLIASFASAQDGFKPLFNGKDLTGWDGNPELWSVEDGCITGKTTGPEQLTYNQFLIWRGGVVKNFELRAKVKQKGNNTGIQYRSQERPQAGKWSIGGYQCDIHPARPNNAMVYEEGGRGIIVQNGQGVVIDPEGKRWLASEHDRVEVEIADWHEYTIIAQGNHLVHKIDGKVAVDLLDFELAKRSLEGLVAFQIHRGPAMVVQIKDVMLKELPEGGVVSFEKSAIPSDAQIIEPKPKGNAKGKGKGKGQPPAPAPVPAPAAPAAPPAPAKGNASAKKKDRPKRPDAVGPAIGANVATPVTNIKTLPDFKVELIYSVPGGEQGSWVNLTSDDQGRIYASDQYGMIYRFKAPAAGQTLGAADIEKVPADIRGVNGMLFAFGALYVGVNDYEKKIPSGVYRITDSNSDDMPDKVEMLREFDAGSDHGVHAILKTPDGKGLYLISGNNAEIKEGPKAGTPDSSPVAKLWGDDHLLPRMPDGRGHNRHRMAPGGIVYRFTPDGKQFEIFASGFRNIFDGGVNRDGELFVYDADMEYDFNTSWYRPTRVNHVVSGGEYGWRNGAGKYPEFYYDNLPATLNIGPGSPTGTTFGYGAKFPAKYQEAFYVLDWSWGKIYAVHLKPSGSTYTATKEEFVTGGPLPVSDAIIGKDGAMYFTIGGRRVQSGLYRVTYAGKEDTAPSQIAAPGHQVHARSIRHTFEAFHGKQDPKAVAAAWSGLGDKDRYIRAAARTALEHQPVAEWESKALAETNVTAQLEALLALTRVTGVCPTHRAADHAVNTAMRDKLWTALLKHDFTKLTPEQRLAYVRLTEIVLHRFGNPDDATVAAIIAKLDPSYPADNFELNWLLTETLAYLQAPNTAAKGMALIAAAESQEPQVEYARSLRFLKTGWTPELRKQQLEFFLKAANYKGGSSFAIFIDFIRKDSLATFTPEENTQFAELIAKKPESKSAIENVGAMFIGRTPTMWTLEELSAAATAKDALKGRSFDNGRKMFGAAACFACHRFGNAGGMTGPDLTGSGGRYSPHDLLDQIINPSKVINEQFAPIVVTKNDGTIMTGVVVNLSGDGVTLNTDLTDPNQRVNVDRKEVKSIELSTVSPMPPMLLAMLKKEEILDLLAYVLSGGDKTNAMFGK
ncbi:MAG TPA: family 16 glycoside hydrolase, partial [Prosthecobacter sp.]